MPFYNDFGMFSRETLYNKENKKEKLVYSSSGYEATIRAAAWIELARVIDGKKEGKKQWQ
jgi:hypothetical protein